MNTYIPYPDILPLPAPVWLFFSLLILTFTVHLIFMNFLFGGTFLAAISHFRGKKDPNHAHLSKKLYKFMPAVIALTVNFGVAPLLFVQVLYGHLLYSSSILMAVAWFSVIPLVIFGYYGTYSLRFKWDKLAKYRSIITWFVSGIFVVIAFIYVNNFTLMLRPENWVTHYFKDPSSGTFNWSDATLFPRYLHVFFGALALAGTWIMIIGVRRRTGDDEWSDWTVNFGSRVFLYTTMINILIGILFLIVHPGTIVKNFMGKDLISTIFLVISVFVTVYVLILASKIPKIAEKKKHTYILFSSTVFLLILMILLRHSLRTFYLEPYFKLDQLQVEPQWTAFLIFAGTMVLFMVPALIWMIKVMLNAKRE
ncbi:hypothetical protein ACFL4T_09175 [candidate division KSB1 bacterium]